MDQKISLGAWMIRIARWKIARETWCRAAASFQDCAGGVGNKERSFIDYLLTQFGFFTCSSWTNKLITAKDHRSVQINIGHLDESGLYTGSFSTFALCGQVRSKVGITEIN